MYARPEGGTFSSKGSAEVVHLLVKKSRCLSAVSHSVSKTAPKGHQQKQQWECRVLLHRAPGRQTTHRNNEFVFRTAWYASQKPKYLLCAAGLHAQLKAASWSGTGCNLIFPLCHWKALFIYLSIQELWMWGFWVGTVGTERIRGDLIDCTVKYWSQ